MSEQEIIEGNKLINRFMGFIHETEVTEYWSGMDYRDGYSTEIIYSNIKPNLKRHEHSFLSQPIAVYSNYFDYDKQPEEFKYNKMPNYEMDWNELMPVVEKINSLASNRIDTAVTISKHKVLIYYIGRHMSVRKPLIELKVDDSLITTTWLAVVDFIKWHNQNK